MKLIYWLASNREEAERVVEALLAAKLIACANIMSPCMSLYEWEGKMERSEEVPVLCKTAASTALTAQSYIAMNHSYDCPAIMILDVGDAHAPFDAWVRERCTG